MSTLGCMLFSLGTVALSLEYELGCLCKALFCAAIARAYGRCFGGKLFVLCMWLVKLHDGLFGRQPFARRHKVIGKLSEVYWYADKAKNSCL